MTLRDDGHPFVTDATFRQMIFDREHTSRSRSALPPRYRAQLAQLVDHAPLGYGWLHEDKFDGYRIGCRVSDGRVQLISRRDQDWTGRFPSLRACVGQLRTTNALLDGEVVIERSDGTTDFQALQNAFKHGGAAIDVTYCVFDLLFLDGHDLSSLPLIERKRHLEGLLRRQTSGALRFVPYQIGEGPQSFQAACLRRLEGIVSKRINARYFPGKRDPSWQKVKCVKRQEFVVGGFTEPDGSREGIGALLVGYYDSAGRLLFAGKVGTGYTQSSARELRQRLDRITQRECPFAARPPVSFGRGLHWVEPELVGEVAFGAWTDEGILRHASFKGLREDKAPSDVGREDSGGREPPTTRPDD